MLQEVNGRIVLRVKVIPRASRSEIVGWENDELKIRLAAVPDKGQANDELIRFLSRHLGVGKTSIVLLNGETSRHKKIAIADLSKENCLKLLGG